MVIRTLFWLRNWCTSTGYFLSALFFLWVTLPCLLVCCLDSCHAAALLLVCLSFCFFGGLTACLTALLLVWLPYCLSDYCWLPYFLPVWDTLLVWLRSCLTALQLVEQPSCLSDCIFEFSAALLLVWLPYCFSDCPSAILTACPPASKFSDCLTVCLNALRLVWLPNCCLTALTACLTALTAFLTA